MSIFKCSESCSSLGMVMPGRSYNSGDYTYGFNGKEIDSEIKGQGNSVHFELREYDARLGRMISIDPRSSEYPWQTSYAYHMNSPIWKIDYLDGGDEKDEKTASKPVKKDVMTKVVNGKPGTIKPVLPATPKVNPDGTPNSNAYNCHSYAWCDSQGSTSDHENASEVAKGTPKWDNDPTNNTSGYKPIPFSQANQVGDRVIYYNLDKNRNKYPSHSGIVTKVDANGNAVEVTSKWGAAGVYKHHPRDVPDIYSVDAPTSTDAKGNKYETRVYYRKTPTIKKSSVLSAKTQQQAATKPISPPIIERYVAPANATYVAPPVVYPIKL